MLAGLCPVEGYSEDIAKFIVIGALGTVFPCLNRIKHFKKKNFTKNWVPILKSKKWVSMAFGQCSTLTPQVTCLCKRPFFSLRIKTGVLSETLFIILH